MPTSSSSFSVQRPEAQEGQELAQVHTHTHTEGREAGFEARFSGPKPAWVSGPGACPAPETPAVMQTGGKQVRGGLGSCLSEGTWKGNVEWPGTIL